MLLQIEWQQQCQLKEEKPLYSIPFSCSWCSEFTDWGEIYTFFKLSTNKWNMTISFGSSPATKSICLNNFPFIHLIIVYVRIIIDDYFNRQRSNLHIKFVFILEINGFWLTVLFFIPLHRMNHLVFLFQSEKWEREKGELNKDIIPNEYLFHVCFAIIFFFFFSSCKWKTIKLHTVEGMHNKGVEYVQRRFHD